MSLLWEAGRFHLLAQCIICMIVHYRMLLRKVRKCLSMFLQKLLLMKLRKLVKTSSSDTAQATKINVDFTIQNSHVLSDKNSYIMNGNARACAVVVC